MYVFPLCFVDTGIDASNLQVGQEHYEVATAVQKILQDYKSLQDIIAILGMDELSEEDKLTVSVLDLYTGSCLIRNAIGRACS